MREIKFRAWDNIKKEWLLGYRYGCLGGFSLFGETVMFGEWGQVLIGVLNGSFGEIGEELKVMQFTGLKDKNGIDIYEGDIVRTSPEHTSWSGKDRGFLMEVKWLNESAAFTLKVIKSYGDDTVGYDNFNMSVWSKKCEVIGNIYENPELLEEKDNE